MLVLPNPMQCFIAVANLDYQRHLGCPPSLLVAGITQIVQTCNVYEGYTNELYNVLICVDLC